MKIIRAVFVRDLWTILQIIYEPCMKELGYVYNYSWDTFKTMLGEGKMNNIWLRARDASGNSSE